MQRLRSSRSHIHSLQQTQAPANKGDGGMTLGLPLPHSPLQQQSLLAQRSPTGFSREWTHLLLWQNSPSRPSRSDLNLQICLQS